MTIEGVDFANPRPSGAALKSEGKQFVIRYLSPNTKNNPRKLITAEEITNYRGAGLDMGFVWETSRDRATQGKRAGIDDAQAAAEVRRARGIPASTVGYFTAQDQENITGPQVAAYFEGVVEEIGLSLTGAYGGHAVLKYLFDHGLIEFGWQTYAWSVVTTVKKMRADIHDPGWEPRAQLQQYHNGVTVAGVTLDLTRAISPAWGQWPADDSIHPSVVVEADMPLTQADAQLVAETLLNMRLGSAGPTVGVALQSGFGFAKDTNADVETIKATLAKLPRAVVAALPTAGENAFTPEQIAHVEAAMSTALGSITVTVTTDGV